MAFVLLAACSGPAGQATQGAAVTAAAGGAAGTAAPQGTAGVDLPGTGGTAGPGATPGAAYVPPDADVCQKMADDVQATLGVENDAVKTEPAAPFQDSVTHEAGAGCLVTVTGAGADFAETSTLAEITGALNVVLQSAGWTVDPAYAAEGPTGSAFALRQGDLLAFVRVEVQAAPEANCPTEQPLSACEADPSLMNSTISANLARRAR